MVMDVREIPLYDAIVVSHLKDREGASEFIALLCDQCANFETQVVISDLADIRDQFRTYNKLFLATHSGLIA